MRILFTLKCINNILYLAKIFYNIRIKLFHDLKSYYDNQLQNFMTIHDTIYNYHYIKNKCFIIFNTYYTIY